MQNSSDLHHKLDKFLRDCQQQAYGIAYLSIKHPSDSLDVVQETMIAFIKYYISKSEDNWRPLFYSVLQNKINDHFRSKKRWFDLFLSPKDEELNTVMMSCQDLKIESPMQHVECDEMNEQLGQAIANLPEKQRQVVLYRLWQEFSVKETAYIMKVSQGSIKTHLSRALANLKGQLGAIYE